MANISNEMVNALSPLLAEKLSFILSLLRAIGIAFIIYIIYLLVRGIFRWKDRKRLIRVEEKLNDLDKKIDKILKSTKNKKSKKKTKTKNKK